MNQLLFGYPEEVFHYLNNVEKPIPPLSPLEYGDLFEFLVQQKNLHMAELLYGAGLGIVAGRDQGGNTLLHYAALRANGDLVKWLIGRGADRDARNRSDQTPRDRVSKRNAEKILQLLTPEQPLFQKILNDPSEFSKGIDRATINEGFSDATLLQIMLKRLFESRFKSIAFDLDRENLAKNILILIDAGASPAPKILPQKTKDRYQSPLYYAALSDIHIFEKIIEKSPELLLEELPNKNTILGQLILEFLVQQKSDPEYVQFLEHQMRYSAKKGAQVQSSLHGVKNFSGSIENFLISRKNAYPSLYSIFFSDTVENLERYAYSLEILRTAL